VFAQFVWHGHLLRCVVRLYCPYSLLFVCFHLVDKWLRTEIAFAVPADKILLDQSDVRNVSHAYRNKLPKSARLEFFTEIKFCTEIKKDGYTTG